MQTPLVPTPPPPKRSLAAVHVTLSLIILAALLLSASTWVVYSHTWDEPEHLAAGVELLDRGRYDYDTEHPPIARALMALGPWLAGAHSYGTPPPDGTQEGVDILYGSGHYGLYLTLARLGVLPFLGLLLWAAWLWARRLGDHAGEALLAVAMLGAVPAVLGHAALATLDSAMVATSLLALWAMQRWIAHGGWREALLFGATLGIAFGTKFSAIPFLGLGFLGLAAVQAVLTALPPRAVPQPEPEEDELLARLSGAAPAVSRPRVAPTGFKPLGWRGRAVAAGLRFASLGLAGVVTAAVLLLAYSFRSAPESFVLWRYHRAVSYLVQQHEISSRLGAVLSGLWLPRPLMDLFDGIVAVKAHNDTGHSSFLLGQSRDFGWWYFYLVALAVKTPIPLLVAGPVGLALKAWAGVRERNSWHVAPAVLFLTTLGFASYFSHINIGIRHVLLLYPFLALGAAYALLALWRWGRREMGPLLRSLALPEVRGWFRREPRRAPALVACAVAAGLAFWQFSTIWTAYPDYLPYFNEAVAHPEAVLVDSDLDWGQDLRRMEARLHDLKVQSLNLAWIGSADLKREDLPAYTLLPPNKAVTGWVAIAALAREHQPQGYTWLDAFKPIERIGKTIDLYYIPPAPEDAPALPAAPAPAGLPAAAGTREGPPVRS